MMAGRLGSMSAQKKIMSMTCIVFMASPVVRETPSAYPGRMICLWAPGIKIKQSRRNSGTALQTRDVKPSELVAERPAHDRHFVIEGGGLAGNRGEVPAFHLDLVGRSEIGPQSFHAPDPVR